MSAQPRSPVVRGVKLSTLADTLILRHLQVSLPDVDDDRTDLREACEPDERFEKRVRCVAIVGAGASAPRFDRGDKLADRLEGQFDDRSAEDKRARLDELYRLERVYDLDPEGFETRLAALSRNPNSTEVVRRAIASYYHYRHPTNLSYELLAHLLKHRFLDAIISFNFDELLDQSLDDELGIGGYRRLVSDRDAVEAVADPDDEHRAYLPLYIKLHGTASDPGTLRFTREAYYELPAKMLETVHQLLDCDLGVIVNVGSSMNGFDLHRLLRIPTELEVHDLSYEPLSEHVREAIWKERREPRRGTEPPEKPGLPPSFWIPQKTGMQCEAWLHRLAREISKRAGKDPAKLTGHVTFQSVDRHVAVANGLDSKPLDDWIAHPESHGKRYVEYLRQRTILELAFSGAKARGLAQLSWLALDRSGKYFELYRREAAKVMSDNGIWSWRRLREAAGLLEHSVLPDVVQSNPALCGDGASPHDEQEFMLRDFDPRDLVERLSRHLGDLDKALLVRTFKNLQEGSEVEIQPTDDRVCSKAFMNPRTLTTLTALRKFTLGLLQNPREGDSVHIACESGEWLAHDGEMSDALAQYDEIEMITAFRTRQGQIRRRFKGRLDLVAIDPWRHNRHMTIICRGGEPLRAVYFARRLRTPLITPVYLGDRVDAERVKRAFDLMFGAAKFEQRAVEEAAKREAAEAAARAEEDRAA